MKLTRPVRTAGKKYVPQVFLKLQYVGRNDSERLLQTALSSEHSFQPLLIIVLFAAPDELRFYLLATHLQIKSTAATSVLPSFPTPLGSRLSHIWTKWNYRRGPCVRLYWKPCRIEMRHVVSYVRHDLVRGRIPNRGQIITCQGPSLSNRIILRCVGHSSTIWNKEKEGTNAERRKYNR